MQTYPVLIHPPTPPQINPTYAEPYYTRTIWHWGMQMYQVPMKSHPTQVYKALLHKDSMTLQNADVLTANVLLNPPLWNQVPQRCATVRQYDIAQCRHTQCWSNHPANQAQVYRTLLHWENVTLHNADVHSADLSHSSFTGMSLPIVLLHKVMLRCWTMQLRMH